MHKVDYFLFESYNFQKTRKSSHFFYVHCFKIFNILDVGEEKEMKKMLIVVKFIFVVYFREESRKLCKPMRRWGKLHKPFLL